MQTELRTYQELLPKAPFSITVDLDNSTKEDITEPYMWTDGVKRRLVPESVAAFATLHELGFSINVASEQTPDEAEPFLRDVTNLALGHTNYEEIFNGVCAMEGGSLAKYRNANGDYEWETIASPEAVAERDRLHTWLQENITDEYGDEGYGRLQGTNLVTGIGVLLPNGALQGVASISLWEDGPHVTDDPTVIPRYEAIRQRVIQAFDELDISRLTAYEAGNGVLRIAPEGVNKATTLELFDRKGMISLSEMGYVCDGLNDRKLAKLIRDNNGHVIAVQNAVQELHDISSFSATKRAGRGYGEFVEWVFPDEYQRQLQMLKEKGLWIVE